VQAPAYYFRLLLCRRIQVGQYETGFFTGRTGPISLQKFNRYVNSQVITSTSANQEAVDHIAVNAPGERGESDNEKMSPFAKCLVTALATDEADYHTGSENNDGLLRLRR